MENKKQFNRLEKAVLEWIEKNSKDPNIVAQVKVARLVERKWTKVGFFLELDVPKTLPPIGSIGERTVINGPAIESEDIEFGATSLIFTKDGYLDLLEMAAAGSFFKEDVNNFKLSQEDSKETKFSCCFCGELIERTDMVEIAISYKQKEDSEKIAQQIFAHQKCLKSRLHPSISNLLEDK